MTSQEDDLWYKDGIIYQIHIKAFKDSNNDGIGDFKGLVEKLDYIQNLGITIIWLLPFYPSPLKDDGYDIADYMSINADYGTIDDFKYFLKQAHLRGLKVITELVLNHTSDQHPWFQQARQSSPGSRKRNYYVWSDTPDKYPEARIIFSDFELSNWTWDYTAKAYYWHRFFSHQPDLNFENSEVKKNILRIIDFWLNLGVDGLRLDAVPYLFEKEGTSCENLPETHQYLKELNSHLKSKHKNKMFLAEANQWPEEAVTYFGQGDECQMAFHFPLMPRIYMSIQMEESFPIIDILEQTPPIPDNCQWALFLRNHDELTLEMVSDEERDYMYKFYAADNKSRINLGIRRRLAPLIENNRRKMELMYILLFSFPGTPIIYYGDEIGMGDNYYLGDRGGVRTPMQWNPDTNAGFSNSNPQRLYSPIIIDPEYHYQVVNVEVQQRSSASLLRWVQKTILIRNNYKTFGRGTIEFLNPNNPKILSFIRKFNKEIILIIVNLSRFSQFIEFQIPEFVGFTPIEAFSRNKFPVIKESGMMLSLSPYDYYWFVLVNQNEAGDRTLPIINHYNEKSFFKIDIYKETKTFANYFSSLPWFKSDFNKIQKLHIIDSFLFNGNDSSLLIIEINYIDKITEYFILAVSLIRSLEAHQFLTENPSAIIAEIKNGDVSNYLVDGLFQNDFRLELLQNLLRRKFIRNDRNYIKLIYGSEIKNLSEVTSTKILRQLNDEIIIQYGEDYQIKFYRKFESGINPGIEIPKALSEKSQFQNYMPYVGSLEYNNSNGNYVIGLVSREIKYQSTGWGYISDALRKFLENIRLENLPDNELIFTGFFNDPDLINKTIILNKSIDKVYPEMIKILSKRTAEFHIAMSSLGINSFVPEDFTIFYQRSIYQSNRSLIKSSMRLLQKNLKTIQPDLKKDTELIIKSESGLLKFIGQILKIKINAKKIRIHGNFHLGNILFTGKDFVFYNFEGFPGIPLSQRNHKRSPLRDAANMIYSTHFAMIESLKKENISSFEEYQKLKNSAEQWWLYISSSFINEYMKIIEPQKLLPDDYSIIIYMFHFYLLEIVIFEIKNILENNLTWLDKPIYLLKYLINYLNSHPVEIKL